MHLDIDPKSHPAWTGGQQHLLDRGGRLSRFQKKFSGFLKARRKARRNNARGFQCTQTKNPRVAAGVFVYCRRGHAAASNAFGAERRLQQAELALDRIDRRGRSAATSDCGWWRRAGALCLAACAIARSARASAAGSNSRLFGSWIVGGGELDLGSFPCWPGRATSRLPSPRDAAAARRQAASAAWSAACFRWHKRAPRRARASWIPAGRGRRDRSRSLPPAPCRRGTDRRRPANWRAARRTTPAALR